MPEVVDVENKQLNVLEIIFIHHVNEHIEDDTLCRPDIDPTWSYGHHVINDFINDNDEQLSPQSGPSNDEW